MVKAMAVCTSASRSFPGFPDSKARTFTSPEFLPLLLILPVLSSGLVLARTAFHLTVAASVTTIILALLAYPVMSTDPASVME